jgi:exopolysaccharide biosynthesis polyprenyl glycosylphosphotransferase
MSATQHVGFDAVSETSATPVEVPWTRTYVHRVLVHDIVIVVVTGLLAVMIRFGSNTSLASYEVSYFAVVFAIGTLWIVSLGLGRCYEMRFLAEGPEEYRRVGNASLRLIGLLSLLAFATKSDVARGFALLYFPLGLLGLITGRWLLRIRLAQARTEGREFHRVVVAGRYGAVRDLITQLERDKRHGFLVVGACVSGGPQVPGQTLGVPMLGTLTGIREAVLSSEADTVAVAGSAELTGEGLRRLSYDLEGTGIDLMVAPTLLNVAGNRISIRPVAGMALLHVDEPELDGARKIVKTVFDRTLALVLFLLVLPVLMALMLAIRLTSRGPALFRQTRVGRDGQLFSLLKLRTMDNDAELRLSEVAKLNRVSGGVLFKAHNDPRVTPLGRVLRKWSLDELPQIVNVIRGQMSMVGPRPPLPTEVAQYQDHTHRRLLVKPGITGLWQVSGRSDLDWEQSVRLDLQYVENWSLGMDLVILAKTLVAVVRSAGAY